jgi:hypothetical protein
MSATHLSPTQQLRTRQAFQSHKYLKELNEATEEAVRCHDRYFAALEKVMTCLLNNSDILEEVRQTIGPEGGAIVPTSPSTRQLVAAYTNWKMSPELDALRVELEALRVLSTEGRHSAKKTKLLSGNVERCSKRCTAVNSAEYQAKVARSSAKAQEKLIGEARAANTKMLELDMSLYQELKANSVWWSTKMVCRANEVYGAFSRLGGRTVMVFPAAVCGSTAGASAQPWTREPMSFPAASSGAAAIFPPTSAPTHDSTRNCCSHPSAGASHTASDTVLYTTGVALDFYPQENAKSNP